MLNSFVVGTGDELTGAEFLFNEALRTVVLVLSFHHALIKSETQVAEWIVWGYS